MGRGLLWGAGGRGGFEAPRPPTSLPPTHKKKEMWVPAGAIQSSRVLIPCYSHKPAGRAPRGACVCVCAPQGCRASYRDPAPLVRPPTHPCPCSRRRISMGYRVSMGARRRPQRPPAVGGLSETRNSALRLAVASAMGRPRHPAGRALAVCRGRGSQAPRARPLTRARAHNPSATPVQTVAARRAPSPRAAGRAPPIPALLGTAGGACIEKGCAGRTAARCARHGHGPSADGPAPGRARLRAGPGTGGGRAGSVRRSAKAVRSAQDPASRCAHTHPALAAAARRVRPPPPSPPPSESGLRRSRPGPMRPAPKRRQAAAGGRNCGSGETEGRRNGGRDGRRNGD